MARLGFFGAVLLTAVFEPLSARNITLDFLQTVHVYAATAFVGLGPITLVESRALPHSSLVGIEWPHFTYIAGRAKFETRSTTSLARWNVSSLINDMMTINCHGMHNPIVLVDCLDTKWGAQGPCCKTDAAFRHFSGLAAEVKRSMK
jgi:hypothetical protein